MRSLGVNINEKMVQGYNHCLTCDQKTMLVSCFPFWEVDEEAFKSGEKTDRDPDVQDEVEVTEEVTAHWCPGCCKMTSISVCVP